MGKTSTKNGMKKCDKLRSDRTSPRGKVFTGRVAPHGVESTRFKTAKQQGEN